MSKPNDDYFKEIFSKIKTSSNRSRIETYTSNDKISITDIMVMSSPSHRITPTWTNLFNNIYNISIYLSVPNLKYFKQNLNCIAFKEDNEFYINGSLTKHGTVTYYIDDINELKFKSPSNYITKVKELPGLIIYQLVIKDNESITLRKRGGLIEVEPGITKEYLVEIEKLLE